jgi:tetratricopeptide (TPR) repeat protein
LSFPFNERWRRADHLVEGTVRRSGDRVRINAQLIRVSDQSHVWAEIYEGEIRDILAIQHEVGTAIARQIVARLSPTKIGALRRVDPVVYDLYLRGRFLWSRRREADRATATFREAIRLDPTFAPAHAGLADTLTAGAPAAALEAADTAVSLDDRLAEAHTAKAHVLMHMLRWADAEREFRRAIALDPSHVAARYFFAEYLTAGGRRAEAIDEALRGLVLDPLSAIATHVAGVTHYYGRDYDAALRYFRRALELDPEHHWTHGRIALVLERQESYDGALAEFATMAPVRALYSYSASGRHADTRRIIRETMSRSDHELHAYYIAAGYVALGDHDAALTWLTTALRRQVYDVVYLNVDPRFDALRQRPEFHALLREGGWR